VIDLEMLVIADVLLFVYLSLESTTTNTTPIPIPNPEPLNDPFITTTPRHHVTTTTTTTTTLAMDAACGLIGDGSLYVSFSIARGTWRLAFVLMMEGSCD